MVSETNLAHSIHRNFIWN